MTLKQRQATAKRAYLRHEAQDELLCGMQAAFHDSMEIDSAIHIEMRKQFRRVEHLFGYERGTWII